MKPEAQRIAIAKACGWTKFTPETVQYTARRSDGKWGPIPDYLNDLNAMHEAIETLRGKDGPQWFDFQRTLMIECGSWMNCIQASAAQRAEAFLKTLNLWKDDN
jgi:hypothetical protein